MANILYVAYPLLTVTEESAGGAEQVLWTLEREMSSRGEFTTVAASAGSRVSGELFATGEPCVQPDDYERRCLEHEDRIVAFVLRRERDGRQFDLIHDMSGSFWRRAAEINTPVLATLHLPRSFYPEGSFESVPENVSFNCVSNSQARSFAGLSALAGVAPNGIALDRFHSQLEHSAEISSGSRDRLLWLGRICEEKAPHLALDIAARAGMAITVAGQVYPFTYHQKYFEREIAPRLGNMRNAEFVQSPSADLKRRLLRQAKALLITSLAQETSSLVAMEAAASATPVIAFRHGALPEVVKEGVTGFIVDDAEQAVEALKHIEDISPALCVQHAQANFSAARMAEKYSKLYASLIRAESGLQLANE